MPAVTGGSPLRPSRTGRTPPPARGSLRARAGRPGLAVGGQVVHDEHPRGPSPALFLRQSPPLKACLVPRHGHAALLDCADFRLPRGRWSIGPHRKGCADATARELRANKAICWATLPAPAVARRRWRSQPAGVLRARNAGSSAPATLPLGGDANSGPASYHTVAESVLRMEISYRKPTSALHTSCLTAAWIVR